MNIKKLKLKNNSNGKLDEVMPEKFLKYSEWGV